MKKLFTLTLMTIGLIFSVDTNAQLYEQVADINPDEGSNISELTVAGDQLFFTATDGSTGQELWVSDGTNDGTHLVKDIDPNGDADPTSLIAYEGDVIFTADNASISGLWISDGTEEGTQLITSFNPDGLFNPSNFTLHEGMLYFDANDGASGKELWVTDGTNSGTQMVKDINPGNSSSDIAGFTSWEGNLYFFADDGTHGHELWTTDGTAEGTELIKDINPGSADGYPFFTFNGFTLYSDELYFRGKDGAHGNEMWKTDGTSDGTEMVVDIKPGSGNSHASEFTVLNDLLYFRAEFENVNKELWVSDGTEEGTGLVKDISSDDSSTPQDFQVYEGTLFFSALTPTYGFDLWSSDGTEDGTQLFKDINQNGDADIPYLRNMLGHLFFPAKDGFDDDIGGFQLWRSDGTASGTVKLSPEDLSPEGDPLGFSNEDVTFEAFDGTIYLAAHFNNDGRELWKLNDESVGVSKNLSDESLIEIYPVPANDRIYLDMKSSMDLIIVNSSGKVVDQLSNRQSGYLDISSFEAGIYTVVNPATGNSQRFIKN